MAPIFVGNIDHKEYLTARVKTIRHIHETQDLNNGDIIEFFDYVFRWDSSCVTEHDCLQFVSPDLTAVVKTSDYTFDIRWRQIGDPSCDAALMDLYSSMPQLPGRDLLETLQQFVGANSTPSAASAFLDEVNRLPPDDLTALPEEVEVGRRLFLDHAAQMMQALLYYSLAAGFASVRITKTLQAVSYLVPPARSSSGPLSQSYSDRTYMRLLETFQFVLDVMGCVPTAAQDSEEDSDAAVVARAGTLGYLLPGGDGWKSIVRVRMLHAVARRRAKDQWIKTGQNSKDIPISQEDMGATLASFCIIPLWCLNRLGLRADHAQAEAFLAIWRHVGFYLGVSPSILRRFFTSTQAGDKFLVSIIVDLFSSDNDIPPDPSGIPTIPILQAVSGRPPGYSSLEYNCAVTRYFAGQQLADHLGVPKTSFMMTLKLHTAFLIHKIPIWFSWWYPRKAWVEKRRRVFSEGMTRTVRWNLGMRCTTFRPRRESDTPDSKETKAIEELEHVNADPVGGMALVTKWREMLAEMTVVCLGIASVGIGAVYLAGKLLLRTGAASFTSPHVRQAL